MKQKAEDFILKQAEETGVDMLNLEFVDNFAKHTGAKLTITMYGANKCGYLSKTLSRMYQEGKLNRYPVGLPSMPSSGFPKWIYHYTVNHDYNPTDYS